MAVFNLYYKFIKALLIAFFIALVCVVSYQLISRNVDFLPRFSGTEEISRWLFIWMIFLGASLAVRENSHLVIDVLPNRIWLNKILSAISIIVVGLVSILFVTMGYQFFQSGLIKTSPMSQLSFAWVYAAIPFSGLSMLIFILEKIITFRNEEMDPGENRHLEGGI